MSVTPEGLLDRDQEKKRLDAYGKAEGVDDRPEVHGVLLRDQIEHYVNTCRLLEPFNRDNLKPASYELRLGDEYAIGGRLRRLPDPATGSPSIEIQPFQVVVAKTLETVNLPKFLIARWNVRVGLAYEGLLWVGGPQVDPGWVGHLFCPIYNLSNRPVTLRMGDEIARIDFVKTSPVKTGDDPKNDYPRPPKRILLADYKVETLQSALFTEAAEKVRHVESTVSQIGSRLDTAFGVTFTVLSLIIAALALQYSSLINTTVSPNWVSNIAFVASLAALGGTLFTLRQGRRDAQRLPLVMAGAAFVGVVALLAVSYQLSRFTSLLEARLTKIESDSALRQQPTVVSRTPQATGISTTHNSSSSGAPPIADLTPGPDTSGGGSATPSLEQVPKEGT